MQLLQGQIIDSIDQGTDTLLLNGKDTIAPIEKNNTQSFNDLLAENKFINTISRPESMVMFKRKKQSKEVLFYPIIILLLFFGLLKMFYSRYLTTLFRVFFNTSLRQSQLTDQLLQAKQPSLFFNILFVISTGYYIYLLLGYLGYIDVMKDHEILLICISAVSVVYSIKFIVLKFTGWISGFKSAADTYIFLVFLINKIIGIALLPVILIMAFSENSLVRTVVLISYIMILLMILLRFLRSYGVLQNRINVKRYHFFLYIIGIEILPLLLIYKTAMHMLTKM
ncbi:MAG: DUF4271 domain-containing protein [Ferruginibacter sp.]